MPAPVYTRNIIDVSVRAGELGQPNEMTWVAVVSRVDRAFIALDQEILAMQNEGAIPAINAQYVTGTVPATMLWERYTRCRSISYQQVDGGRAIRFTILWSTYWAQDQGTTSLEFVLPAQTDYLTRTRVSNIYRTGWTVNPSNTNASADIGGTSITQGSLAKGEDVAQIVMRLRMFADATLDPISNTATKLASYVNNLNSATFAGFPIGSVLCEGVTVNKQATGFEFYEIIFEFLVDNWYFLDQVADTDEKGYPILNSSQAPKVVKWKRVARSSTDFNGIFGTLPLAGGDIRRRDRALKGWWS